MEANTILQTLEHMHQDPSGSAFSPLEKTKIIEKAKMKFAERSCSGNW